MTTTQQRAIEALREVMKEYDAWKARGRIADDRLSFIEARAALAAVDAEPAQEPAITQFKECGGEEIPEPLERLRFFCSLAMSGQDWLDVEPFFVALEQAAEPMQEPVAGWKLVPVEPTREMIQAACDKHGYPGGSRWVYWGGYNAMLAVAPTPPTPQRKPLTDEQIDALWRAPMPFDWEHREFARAVEEAVWKNS